ncbi:UDP-glucose 4-epimerase [Saliniradius amylolyticus]|uniref:UDP-glucose 4-epimerase n=1 Tax=Saliniradius amylolyticus TaxID=2183582 RepID=A0A2S2E3K9_9ALTE|nr:SDR family oxidoreductase [Saliniradius amylolyticus]AWL12179.1 UDP-glucose 4-epimerase [Saliniradius amylolyticus]
MSRILITGSQGYLGKQVVSALAGKHQVFGIDIIDAEPPHYHYRRMDIRSQELVGFMGEAGIEQVVHLASIVTPSQDRARDYDIEVNGTRNLLDACVTNGVNHLTVTSSGAAYGYHADSPDWLTEIDPVRGNYHFSYSYHKRKVEEMLADFRQSVPQLHQLILRPGTILGKETDNLITRLFKKSTLLAVQGSDSPFVFILDKDVADIVVTGVDERKTGIYNLAGDGALSMDEIAAILNKPVRTLPAWLLKVALWVGQRLHLTPYGPEQLDFLRYRPVLSNRALKEQFGFTPSMNSRQVFEYYAHHQGMLP